MHLVINLVEKIRNFLFLSKLLLPATSQDCWNSISINRLQDGLLLIVWPIWLDWDPPSVGARSIMILLLIHIHLHQINVHWIGTFWKHYIGSDRNLRFNWCLITLVHMIWIWISSWFFLKNGIILFAQLPGIWLGYYKVFMVCF